MKKNSILNIFGLGKMPFSASLASLIPVPVYYLTSLHLPHAVYINISFFLLILAWSMLEINRDRAYAEEDPREVVVDELLGMQSALIIACTVDILWIAVLFVFFRVFDRFKVFPVNVIERKLAGPYGLLWDDIAVGVGSAMLFRLTDYVIWHSL